MNRSQHVLFALAALVLAGHASRAELPVAADVWVARGAATRVLQGNDMLINQQVDRTILDWKSFNIGPQNGVDFRQPSAASVALNRIHQSDPSRIFGRLTANGQIYLINQNGILFGQGAKVNVNTLVASSLPISEEIFDLGIANAINHPDGAKAAFEASGPAGPVVIERGAELSTPEGGQVLVFAPKVSNRGRIETPDGQAILAAAQDKVYLTPANDQNLRGLLVEVDTGGEVSNLGEIVAERGNISLAGLSVNQDGLARATTSVNLNGSIRLQARDDVITRTKPGGAVVPGTNIREREALATRTGSVTLGPNSRTEVLPDSASGSAIDAQAQPESSIAVMGKTVEVASGARISAPAGRVDVIATVDPRNPVNPSRPDNDARLRIGSGAVIDVSGSDSGVVSVSRNVVAVEARSNELRDAPLQRNSALTGQTLLVDVRRGTPLLDFSGAGEGIQRSILERTANAGTITLVSEGDLTVEPGAVLDVSGGLLTYESGLVNTSKLISEGQVFDIAEADPARRYDGILGEIEVTHQKWGVIERFLLSSLNQFEPGYVEGKDAGRLVLNGRRVQFHGDLRAGVTAGRFQRLPATSPAAFARPFRERPLAGGLEVVFDPRAVEFPRIVLGPADPGEEEDLFLSTPLIAASELGRLTINTPGSIHIASGSILPLGPGGSFVATAGALFVDGVIESPSGRIDLVSLPSIRTEVPGIAFGPGGSIDTSGEWVNDSELLSPDGATGPVAIHGGDISLTAAGDLVLSAGSSLDTGGGAHQTVDGEVEAGRGGSISLETEDDSPTRLLIGGELKAFALEQGGELNLSANGFVIGGEAPDEFTNRLEPAFFASGGFSDYGLAASRTGVLVAAGTTVELSARNLSLLPGFATVASGTDIETMSEVVRLPDVFRGPVDLSLSSKQKLTSPVSNEITLAAGSAIIGDIGTKISLSGDRNIYIDGRIDAPAGEIAMRLSSMLSNYDPAMKIRLGPTARLSSGPATRLSTDDLGRRQGEILDAGRVAIVADRGAIVLAPGSEIDVSGGFAELDLPSGSALHPEFLAQKVAAGAGAIELTAAETILVGGALSARAGDAPGARGGRLAVTLDTRNRQEDIELFFNFPSGPRIIDLGGAGLPQVGRLDELPGNLNGRALLPPDTVARGGFAALDLTALPVSRIGAQATDASTAAIRFRGDVTLSLNQRIVLDAPIIAGPGTVSLAAPYLRIGSTDPLFRIAAEPDSGAGSFTATGSLIELVNTAVFQDFGALSLASSGDIRLRGLAIPDTARELRGELKMAGQLTLTAAQIYPTTLSDFDIEVIGDDGLITVRSGGAAAAPLSAFGRATLTAANIEQHGTLRAPFGQLGLTAAESLTLGPGSLTSVSGQDLRLPFGRTQFGDDVIFPLNRVTRVFGTDVGEEPLPAKDITLDARRVNVAAGARIDVSGGGSPVATEFIPGPGGSTDILLADQPDGAFAVVPGLGSAFAPYDPLESPDFGFDIGETIFLNAGNGLRAGEYALLPARYALFGGYLVTPQAATQDMLPGQGFVGTDGVAIVAGKRRFAGGLMEESRWSGYAIENGTQVRARAEFAEAALDTLFAGAGMALPEDAGGVVIDARTHLSLAGSLTGATRGGRGSRVDILSDRIAVVNDIRPGTGEVQILAADLSNFGADSLLLGGRRTVNGAILSIDIAASELALDPGVLLTSPEIILGARDRLSVAAGARLQAAGRTLAGGETVDLIGDGAVARVSTGAQVTIQRQSPGITGDLVVAEGALISASGSITLDASRDARIAGTLHTSGSLGLGASRVSLGDTTGVTDGLVLSNSALAGLAGSEISLRSTQKIDLIGHVAGDFRSLTLNAPGLRGVSNTGLTSMLSADRIELRGAVGAGGGAGSGGALVLDTDTLLLGAGEFSIAGFDTITAGSRSGIMIASGGRLEVSGDLTLSTPLVAASSGAEYTVQTPGLLQVTGAAGANASADESLGASLSLAGSSLNFDTLVRLPSGAVTLRATGAGGLTLGAGAHIDVAGVDRPFGDLVAGTPGGDIDLLAENGPITVHGGAKLNVSRAATGDLGGTLAVSAPAGTVALAPGTLLRGAGGALQLDVGSADSLGALAGVINAGGFERAQAYRVRHGDVALGAGAKLRAAEVEVTADQGSLVIDGTVIADGDSGGSITLQAQRDLTVGDAARLSARALDGGGAGGEIYLASRAGTLNIGGQFDVSGRDDAANVSNTGLVRFTAARTGNASVGVTRLPDAIAGAGRVELEATRKYQAAAVLSPALITTIRNDVGNLDASGIKNALGRTGDDAFHVIPGVEVTSAGNLLLVPWDLSQLRVDGQPGVLTIRSAGNLTLFGDLSDGFALRPVWTGSGFVNQVRLMDGLSWSYNLVAGADLGGGDRLALGDAPATLLLSSQVQVRTGTGDINIATSGGLTFFDNSSTIYTAGRKGQAGPLSAVFATGGDQNAPIGEAFLDRGLNGGEFPIDGGDIHIVTGGDAQGGGVFDQLVTAWQPRIGQFNSSFGDIPRYWGIAFDRFRQGIGALGGGKLQADIGGDMINLALVVPSVGFASNPHLDPARLAQDQIGFLPGADVTEVRNTGALSVNVAGDVAGGMFHVGKGTASIRVRGDLTESPFVAGVETAPIVALGDADVRIDAGGTAVLQTILNPSILPQIQQDLSFLFRSSYYFTYAAAGAVRVRSLTGDVVLNSELPNAVAARTGLNFDSAAVTVAPPVFDGVAFDGDIRFRNSLTMFPSPSGQLDLLAEDNVIGSNVVTRITQPDGDPEPGLAPSQQVQPVYVAGNHALVPLHLGDPTRNHIIANAGNVGTEIPSQQDLELVLSKQTTIRAGGDIRDISLDLQHNNPSDLTVIEASGSIIQAPERRADGIFRSTDRRVYRVGGPGDLQFVAGGRVDLGTSAGIVTVGNLNNLQLPSAGADVTVFAGIGESLDLQGFTDEVIAASDTLLARLATFLAGFATDPALSPVENFKRLPAREQSRFIVDVFFDELHGAGIEGSDNGNFGRGFALIDALFPGHTADAGDLSLLLSQITTVSGGDINLLVPGGLINGGVASSEAVVKDPEDLGVIVQRDGDIRAYVHGDFIVNQSRVFALDGGDIMIWSSIGDIDAGRGAKTAIAVPPPVITRDAQGNLSIEFPPAITGSGIRAAVSTTGRPPGDVFLFAPSGVVSAGDAGIFAEGNLTIGAVAVIGADNISVGGVSVGVPTVSVGSVAAGLTGASDASSAAAKSAEDAVGERLTGDEDEIAEALAQSSVGFITVEILGFGDETL